MSRRKATEAAILREVLAMYRRGWFPMHDDERGVVEWVQPRSRWLLPLDDKFHVGHSLGQRVRSGRYVITCDRAFGEVIRACAEPGRGRERTWLNDDIITLFEGLHRAGHAHSVEAWAGKGEKTLVGGLYGLALGRVFCGESMFSMAGVGTDASKVCLVHLVEHLRTRGFVVLDAQLPNPHLAQFGMYEMARDKYLRLVERHGEEKVDWAWGEAKADAPPRRRGRREAKSIESD